MKETGNYFATTGESSDVLQYFKVSETIGGERRYYHLRYPLNFKERRMSLSDLADQLIDIPDSKFNRLRWPPILLEWSEPEHYLIGFAIADILTNPPKRFSEFKSHIPNAIIDLSKKEEVMKNLPARLLFVYGNNPDNPVCTGIVTAYEIRTMQPSDVSFKGPRF